MSKLQHIFRAALPVLALSLFAPPAMAGGEPESGVRVATADFFSCAKPVWPKAALAEQRQGTVTLLFEVENDGTVLRSRVEKSSGHADLDEAAREGIAKCTFMPGTNNGVAVRSTMQMQYVWTLK